ncbi:MAG: alpha/beta hydrolase [Deltaproteobacteria bacterium]|nr:alpha/beta hydrolase [Deltaproteobacteria bacterium]MCB9489063.1 alpha/beta hydrolase [Deltaproteobacteria bacterium]
MCAMPPYDESAWEHEYIEAGGLRFHMVTAGEGPVVLMLHGFPENWFAWRYQIDAVAKAGFKAVAVDMRGYGQTERPRKVSDYHLDKLAADVDALVEAFGGEQIHLVAHDWGGGVAWHYAMHYEQRLASLCVMNCPHPKLFLQQLTSNGKQRRRSWYMAYFQIPWLPEATMKANLDVLFKKTFRGWAYRKEAFPDEVIARFRDPMKEPYAVSAGINYYRANLKNRKIFNDIRSYPHLKVPTLVIWAQKDRALGPELCDGLDQMMDGPYEYVPIPDCSHWVQQEQPEKVNEALIDFLNRHR